MTEKEIITDFLSSEAFALAGVSNNKDKFGNYLYDELIKKGIKTYPLNPSLSEYKGVKCYPSLDSLPEKVDALICSLKPKNVMSVLEDAKKAEIKKVWLQQGSESKEAIEFCKANNINVVSKRCLMMFIAEDSFPHNLHKFLSKFFGKYPK
ncbi:MAG: CoA-binding protein [Candidatus Kapabacteria bacterium]|nr:CoA-binding protein [Candidatus Kapabacteria bacterium]